MRRIDRTRNQAVLGASAIALAAIWATPALAQQTPTPCTVDPEDSLCVIENTGASGQIVLTGGRRLVNTGTITAGPAISGALNFQVNPTPATIIIENRVGGAIIGGNGVAIISPGVIINAGTIIGNVIGVGTYVSGGGGLTGNLVLGSGQPSDTQSQAFIQRAGTTGVSGTIDAGAGLDFYALSYDDTVTVTLADQPLPTSFELRGVEAFGRNSVITLGAQGASPVAGLVLFGEGSIVNNTRIDQPAAPTQAAISFGGVPEKSVALLRRFVQPSGVPIFAGVVYGGGLTAFTNNAIVNGDVRMRTGSFVNTGTLNLRSNGTGTLIETGRKGISLFRNAGAVNLTLNGARQGVGAVETQLLGDEFAGYAVRIRNQHLATTGAATIDNSGSIVGGLHASLLVDTATITNSGTITAAADDAPGLSLSIGQIDRYTGVEENALADSISFTNTATGEIAGLDGLFRAVDLTFANNGRIVGDTEGRALSIDHEGLNAEDHGETAAIDSLVFVNGAGGMIVGAALINTEASDVSVVNDGEITAGGSLTDPIDIANSSLEAVEIEVETAGDQTIGFVNTGNIAQTAIGAVAVSFEVASETGGSTIDIVNSGAIVSNEGAALVDATLFGGTAGEFFVKPSAALAIDAGDVATTSSVTIDNQAGGIISASGELSIIDADGITAAPNPGGAFSVAIVGTATSIDITNAGQILGGTGTALPADVINDTGYQLPDDYLAGAIQTGGSTDSIMNLATGIITGSIDLGLGDDIIVNMGAITGDVFLRGGNDLFRHFLTASITGTIDGGDGEDTLQFDTTGTDGNFTQGLRDQFLGFEIFQLVGSVTQVIIDDSGEFVLTEDMVVSNPGGTAVSGGEGAEDVAIAGTVEGDIDLGEGDNSLANTGTITGDVTTGGGNDDVANAAGGTVTGDVALGEGDNSFANMGMLTGDVTTGAGSDQVSNDGTLVGNVDLGDGADGFALGPNGSFAGTASGGEGTDMLDVTFAGSSEAAPTVLDLGQFESFETFTVSGGTGKIEEGTASFETIAIEGGRLIGGADTTIVADMIAVAAGGTFGSAGEVQGDLDIDGTLSPGASPGTMTIIGDVNLGASSVTLFEMTPTISDAIVIDGALIVEAGATLRLTGARPLTPGAAYNLITTTDGISGSFVIDKAAGVLGFIRQTTNSLQLLGQFVLQGQGNPQALRATDYLNTLLIAGTATDGIIDAVPTLLTSGGFADEADMLRLTPEAYASATQIGTENGLALASAGRAMAMGEGLDEAGWFTFGQVFGNWRKLPANAALGTTRANVSAQGALGGIGMGSQTASIGAFIGYIDAKQTLGALGARTDADGVIAGVAARVAIGDLAITGLVAYDGSDASTRRTLPDGTNPVGSYDLHSWTFDASASYAVPLGASWSVRPTVGITHISTERGAASESGASPFALDVDRRTSEATFVDGYVTFTGDLGGVRPWVSGGVRHQIGGNAAPLATGRFSGVAPSLTVPGAPREETMATAGAGLSIALSPGASLNAGFEAEFGDTNRQSANAGFRVRF